MAADRALKQILVCAAALIVFCVVCRFTVLNSYTVYIPMPPSHRENVPEGGAFVEADAPEVLNPGQARIRDGYMEIPIEPQRAGESFLSVQDAGGESLGSSLLKVSPLGTVYDYSSGSFTGDKAVLVAVPLFWLLVSAIMLWHLLRAKGPAFYSYASIYYAGFFLFSLSSGLVIGYEGIRHLMNPREHTMFMVYGVIKGAAFRFMFLSAPLVAAFALSMIVSNIALLRHERPRVQNVLGILISLFLIAGELLGWFMFSSDFSGSETAGRILETIQNTYATVFVYCECMLIGSVVCGVRAAKHLPSRDQDFIVILGCWFRKDGSLPPLLKGRVDRAIAFWRQQKEENGKEAILIPSGGQGRNESMPEAEAMKRYLLSRGVPEEKICPEDQSANTYQNMEFSGRIVRRINPEGKVIFSTTNYHVFRSGVWAGLAGLDAEGIGSATKWWYWPNAFMREVIGLLKNRWKQELAFLLLLLVFFGMLSAVLN